jgi:hypothetical protein
MSHSDSRLDAITITLPIKEVLEVLRVVLGQTAIDVSAVIKISHKPIETTANVPPCGLHYLHPGLVGCRCHRARLLVGRDPLMQ